MRQEDRYSGRRYSSRRVAMTTAWYGSQYSERRRHLHEYHKAQFYRSTGLSRTSSDVGMSSFTVSLLVGRRDLEMFQRVVQSRPTSSAAVTDRPIMPTTTRIPRLPVSASAPLLSSNDVTSNTQQHDVTKSCRDVSESVDVRQAGVVYSGSDSHPTPQLLTSSLTSLFLLNSISPTQKSVVVDSPSPSRSRPLHRRQLSTLRSPPLEVLTPRLCASGSSVTSSASDGGPSGQRLKLAQICRVSPNNNDDNNNDKNDDDDDDDDDADDDVVVDGRSYRATLESSSSSSSSGPPDSSLNPACSPPGDASALRLRPLPAPPPPVLARNTSHVTQQPTKLSVLIGRQNRTYAPTNGVTFKYPRPGLCGYADPVQDSCPDFQQRINELAVLQLDTIRWEKTRRPLPQTAAATAASRKTMR